MNVISIGLVTYNASSFVIEALESVYNQSYANIHLIISDDCSKDDTVAKAQDWINQARVKQRFLSIELLTVPKNTGVSANCNRIIKASKTDWIKFHAGDDILLPNCIEDNMKFVQDNPEAKILFSQIQVYQDTFVEANFVRTTPEQFPNNLFHPNFDAKKQFELLLYSDRIHFTPSYMFNRQALAEVGYYDETQRLVEDYPMWLKLTQAGIRLHYFHQPTVGYRIHGNATNNTGEVLFKPSVINGFEVRRKYAHPHLPWTQVRKEWWVYRVSKMFKALGFMKASALNKMLYRFLKVFMNPFFWLHAMIRRIK